MGISLRISPPRTIHLEVTGRPHGPEPLVFAAPARREIRTLQLASHQLDAIRDQLRSGVERAARHVRDVHATDTSVAVGTLGICLLADFPKGALVHGDGELTASVTVRLGGAISGTGVLAMDPEDALGWVRASDSPADPLDTFVELGQRVLSGALSALAESRGSALELGVPTLVEDSVVSILLGTHAPSDTVMLSAALAVSAGPVQAPATLYVLVDPKVLSAISSTTD